MNTYPYRGPGAFVDLSLHTLTMEVTARPKLSLSSNSPHGSDHMGIASPSDHLPVQREPAPTPGTWDRGLGAPRTFVFRIGHDRTSRNPIRLLYIESGPMIYTSYQSTDIRTTTLQSEPSESTTSASLMFYTSTSVCCSRVHHIPSDRVQEHVNNHWITSTTSFRRTGKAAEGSKPLVHLNPPHIPCLTTQALWLHLIAMRPFALFLGACVGKISNKVGRFAMPWLLAIERATRLNRISITCAPITFGRADWTNHPLLSSPLWSRLQLFLFFVFARVSSRDTTPSNQTNPVVLPSRTGRLRLNSLMEVNLDFLPAGHTGPTQSTVYCLATGAAHLRFDPLLLNQPQLIVTYHIHPNSINGAAPGQWQRAADHYPSIAEFLSSLERCETLRQPTPVPPERKAWPVVGSGYLPSPFDFRDGACRRRLVSTNIGSSSVRNRCQSTFSTRLSTTTTFGASSHHLTYRVSVDGHMYPYAGYGLWIMITGCSRNLDTLPTCLSSAFPCSMTGAFFTYTKPFGLLGLHSSHDQAQPKNSLLDFSYTVLCLRRGTTLTHVDPRSMANSTIPCPCQSKWRGEEVDLAKITAATLHSLVRIRLVLRFTFLALGGRGFGTKAASCSGSSAGPSCVSILNRKGSLLESNLRPSMPLQRDVRCRLRDFPKGAQQVDDSSETESPLDDCLTCSRRAHACCDSSLKRLLDLNKLREIDHSPTLEAFCSQQARCLRASMSMSPGLSCTASAMMLCCSSSTLSHASSARTDTSNGYRWLACSSSGPFYPYNWGQCACGSERDLKTASASKFGCDITPPDRAHHVPGQAARELPLTPRLKPTSSQAQTHRVANFCLARTSLRLQLPLNNILQAAKTAHSHPDRLDKCSSSCMIIADIQTASEATHSRKAQDDRDSFEVSWPPTECNRLPAGQPPPSTLDCSHSSVRPTSHSLVRSTIRLTQREKAGTCRFQVFGGGEFLAFDIASTTFTPPKLTNCHDMNCGEGLIFVSPEFHLWAETGKPEHASSPLTLSSSQVPKSGSEPGLTASLPVIITSLFVFSDMQKHSWRGVAGSPRFRSGFLPRYPQSPRLNLAAYGDLPQSTGSNRDDRHLGIHQLLASQIFVPPLQTNQFFSAPFQAFHSPSTESKRHHPLALLDNHTTKQMPAHDQAFPPPSGCRSYRLPASPRFDM
ncbi:uncharacterized protein CLUP02_13010 [Colletotrichum lupini]|uniref:Uncharacterized protein n=1 Tax=Colletotrichum lupini TaxID=145971 RepID=A0A9Q8T2B5_9PEZI|nr:uncharacterized protein CLUP02_13010 [Colletotrichum lupini]UQC87505.1 hypothetical protein CLUP02_13010 [Colletotrichum lupini]